MARAATITSIARCRPEQYDVFYTELIAAKSVPLKRFEDTHWFESCLPIEEAARRGVDTLRYGPMKPRGLPDPKRAASRGRVCSFARKI